MNDIKVKLRLYLGKQQALIIQDYQNLALIVSAAFGNKGEKSGPPPAEVSKPQTVTELQAAFGSVFG